MAYRLLATRLIVLLMPALDVLTTFSPFKTTSFIRKAPKARIGSHKYSGVGRYTVMNV
jgi:hypothetical protein